MSIPLMVLTGMLVGLGLALIVAGATPAQPRLGDVLTHLAAPPALTVPQAAQEATPDGDRIERLGAAVQSRVAHLPGMSTPSKDLALLGVSPARFWGEKVACALLGLASPTLAAALCALLGAPLPLAVPALGAIALAVVLWMVPDATAARRAAQAREEFGGAVVAYLRLVAIRRLGASGVVSSLEGAARVSDAWVFTRIREELALATLSGSTPWDALEQLSVRLQVPELKEVADITRMSDRGAGISQNLLARASSVRDRNLARELRRANDATTELTAPISLLVIIAMATLLYPAISAILGS